MAQTGNTSGQGNTRRTPIYKDWTVLLLAALVLALDQYTKYLVVELLPFRWSFPSEGFFRFTHVHNTGSAFGILQGLNTPLIFVSFVGVIILVLIYRSQAQPNNWLRLSLGLQLGGAFGNLIDRLRLGYVTDFIDIGPWPVFNLADASIVTGLVLLAWIFLKPGQDRRPRPAAIATQSLAHRGGYLWCPICDGEMTQVSDGWRCLSCGVKEWIDLKGAVSQPRERQSVLTSTGSPDGHPHQGFSTDHSVLASGETRPADGVSNEPVGRFGKWPSHSPTDGEVAEQAANPEQEAIDLPQSDSVGEGPR